MEAPTDALGLDEAEPLTAEQVAAWQERGFVLVDGVFPQVRGQDSSSHGSSSVLPLAALLTWACSVTDRMASTLTAAVTHRDCSGGNAQDASRATVAWPAVSICVRSTQ